MYIYMNCFVVLRLDMFPDPKKRIHWQPGMRKPPPNKYVINNFERLTKHRFRLIFHQVSNIYFYV